MALWHRTYSRMGHLLAGSALAVVIAGPALADFPGAQWNVDYVRVDGTDPTTASALSRGLVGANQIYFYGDRNTRMDAVVSGTKVDLRIVDPSSGTVIAEQAGLPFDAADPAGSIQSAALSWMDGLGCVDGCAMARSGVVAQPATVIAAVTPEPEPEQEPEPEPVVVAETLVEPEPEPEAEPIVTAEAPTEPEPTVGPVPLVIASADPATEVAAVEPPVTAPQLTLALPNDPVQRAAPQTAPNVAENTDDDASFEWVLDEPTPAPTPETVAPTSDEIAAIVTAPAAAATEGSVQNPSAALDLAEAPAAPAPSLAAPNVTVQTPTPGASSSELAFEGLDADQFLTEAATPEPSQLAQPSDPQAPALAPAEAEQSLALSLPATPAPRPVEVPAPQTEELTIAAAPSASVETPAAPEIAAPSQPEPEIATPAVPEPEPEPEPESPSAASTAEAALQEVAPGVSLPQPGTQVAASPLTPTVSAPPQEPAEAPEPAPSPSVAAQAPADPAPAPAEPETTVETPAVAEAPAVAAPAPEAPSTEPAQPAEDLDGTELALANPAAPVAAGPLVTDPGVTTSQPAAPVDEAPQSGAETQADPSVETQVAAIDPDATGPTLANARWVGFTPAVYTGSDTRSGAWISGPFDRKQRTGWITDTATGATTRVTFIWREGGQGGRTAILSRDAAQSLGLGQGDVANVAVYLPR